MAAMFERKHWSSLIDLRRLTSTKGNLSRSQMFLPDPGGVRSMGPGVSMSVQDLWLRLC